MMLRQSLDSDEARPVDGLVRDEPDEPNGHVVLDEQMRCIFALIEQLGSSTLPILLLGETGSGKEVMADFIHRSSRLSQRTFLKINCAGLTESVVESELFGHERGAFTGAMRTHCGVFERADAGTLLLDEVGELPSRTQAKLLRVLETGEFMRLGGTQTLRCKVRLISATHRDLLRQVEGGEFRRDLYFRLSGATIEVPALRQRQSEIVPLAELFLKRAAEQLGKRLALDSSARTALRNYPWPGNIRELRNAMERAAALCDGVVGAGGLTLGRPLHAVEECVNRGVGPLASGRTQDLRDPSSDAGRHAARAPGERARIIAALDQTHGNQTRAALLLGVSRRTLTTKLDRHEIGRPRKGAGTATVSCPRLLGEHLAPRGDE